MNACVLHAFSIGLKLKPFTTDRQARPIQTLDHATLSASRSRGTVENLVPRVFVGKQANSQNYQPCVIFQSRSISHFWRMARASGYPKISAASRSRVRKRLRITFLVSLGSPCYRLTSTSDVFSLPFAYVIGVVRCSNC